MIRHNHVTVAGKQNVSQTNRYRREDSVIRMSWENFDIPMRGRMVGILISRGKQNRTLVTNVVFMGLDGRKQTSKTIYGIAHLIVFNIFSLPLKSVKCQKHDRNGMSYRKMAIFWRLTVYASNDKIVKNTTHVQHGSRETHEKNNSQN